MDDDEAPDYTNPFACTVVFLVALIAGVLLIYLFFLFIFVLVPAGS